MVSLVWLDLPFYLQLEERIDTLSKECRAKKSSAEAAQIQISELREELQQASTTLRHRAVYLSDCVSTYILSYKGICAFSKRAVRVAEWSKAPDSRIPSLLASASSKHSGPRMWAWVRIPPLTDFFPSLVITAFFSFTPGCLKMHYGIKKFLPLVFIFFLSWIMTIP